MVLNDVIIILSITVIIITYFLRRSKATKEVMFWDYRFMSAGLLKNINVF